MLSFTVDRIKPLADSGAILSVSARYGDEQYLNLELMGLMIKTFESQTGKSLEIERGDTSTYPNLAAVQEQLYKGDLTFIFPDAAQLRELPELRHKLGEVSDGGNRKICF